MISSSKFSRHNRLCAALHRRCPAWPGALPARQPHLSEAALLALDVAARLGRTACAWGPSPRNAAPRPGCWRALGRSSNSRAISAAGFIHRSANSFAGRRCRHKRCRQCTASRHALREMTVPLTGRVGGDQRQVARIGKIEQMRLRLPSTGSDRRHISIYRRSGNNRSSAST